MSAFAAALLLCAPLAASAAAAAPPHIIFVVGDDVGANDLGARNGGRTQTPTLDGLIAEGITLTDYYAFKICSPSRASMLTGRYPWGAGFYDMSNDGDHTTTNFTLFPELLRGAGYATAALGKWDAGSALRSATPTYRGFDTFLGYYYACQADYFYHAVPPGNACLEYNASTVDFSDNAGTALAPARVANGTYSRSLLSDRAAAIIAAHDAATPLFMYAAFHNAHEACLNMTTQGVQAPLATVQLYANTTLDTHKIAGAMTTELDLGVAAIVAALRARGMYDNTLLVFVSDNGGPLDHSSNYPLRGGKHTFYEGGVRVEAFVSGGALPAARRGSSWRGLAHAADWYVTLVEGAAGAAIAPGSTGGPRPLDSLNLWPALLAGGASPRGEVVIQVNNSYFSENCSVIRVGEMKLIRGDPGDSRTVAWPPTGDAPVPLGRSGGVLEPGTDHVRGSELAGGVVPGRCRPHCLYNLSADVGEQVDVARQPGYAALARALAARLDAAGAEGPPHAYIWPPQHYHQVVQKQLCDIANQLGTVEPADY